MRDEEAMSIAWLFDDNITPRWASAMEARLTERMEIIMALVSVEETELADLDQALDEATAAIADRIQALIDAGTLPSGEAEVVALQQDVENLRSLAAPSPAGS